MAVRRLALTWAGRPNIRSATLGFAAVAIVGFADGGYYERSWVWIALGFGAVAALALVLGSRATLGRLEYVSLGTLAALTLLILASGIWGIAGTEALREAERSVIYVVALAAFLLVVQPVSTRALLAGVLAGIVALCAYALGERALTSPPLDPFQGALLVGTLGYANALGVLAAVGLLIAIGLTSIERSTPRRGLAVLSAAILLVALWLTSSRGAWASAACGLIVLIAFHPRFARSRAWDRHAAALVCVAVVALLVLATAGPPGALGDRRAYWRAALRDAGDNPLLGSGAGSFDDYWYAHRDVPVNVRDAHSVYLESLAELGAIGLMLLIGSLAPPVVAAVRSRAEPVTAVAIGAYVAFAIHAGLDWDWEMPATVIAALACAAALLEATRPPPTSSEVDGPPPSA